MNKKDDINVEAKDEVILRQRREITELSTAIEDCKETISELEVKMEEKRKCIEEANDCIRLKDSQITYLKQQISLITDKAPTNTKKLQLLLEYKEKEISNIMKQLNELIMENKRLKTGHEELTRSVCESIPRHSSYGSQLRLRSENKVSSKENKRDMIEQPKKDVASIEAKQYNLTREPQLEYNQEDERLQKEVIIAEELSKLPEVAALYKKNLKGLDPIEQIAQSIDFLVETIRVSFKVNI